MRPRSQPKPRSWQRTYYALRLSLGLTPAEARAAHRRGSAVGKQMARAALAQLEVRS